MRAFLAAVVLLSFLAPSIVSADWDDPPSTSICDTPSFYGTEDYHKYCDRPSTPVYVPPPDPRVQALQRANQRFTDLVWQWRRDFQFVSVDDWQNMDRSSEAAFLGAADRLDRAFIDQINDFAEDLQADRGKVESVAVYNRRIEAYQHNIAAVERDLKKYEPSLAAAREELDRLSAQLQTFESLRNEAKESRRRNQYVSVEALSVYLPKSAVKLDVNTVNRYRREEGIPLEGQAYPFVDQNTPNLAVSPPWMRGEFDNGYQVAAAVAAAWPARYPYKRLPHSPEDAVAVLEADERRAAAAFRKRNDYDKAHIEFVDYDRKKAEVERLEKRQTEKMDRLTEVLDQRKVVYPKLNAARVNVKSAAYDTLNRVAESLVWEVAKNTVIYRCKKIVSDTTHAEMANLHLPDSAILDKYKDHIFNVFNMPNRAFRMNDIKAVQNDILTLLKQDQLYAKTAVRLAASTDPAQIKAFVDGMFSRLDADGAKLVDDALSASPAMPEPTRTLVSRYFRNSFHSKPGEDE